MRRFVSLQRSTARLVILVMLAAALFPSLGHGFAADKAGGFGWLEVCTAGGVELRSVALDDKAPIKPSLLVEHCPYCLVSSFDDAFLPVFASPLFSASDDLALSVSTTFAGGAAPIRSAALPRAPPVAL